MRWREVATPIGPLGVAAEGEGICRISFSGVPGDLLAGPSGTRSGGDDVLLDRSSQALLGYFEGALTDFDLPLVVTSGTGFERAVWRAIASIPYAEMRTYGQIAADVGQPDAARAVGIACNRNPLPIVVPCHRVVGAGGKLVGFGGGLHRKRHLLELEAKVRIARDFTADSAGA